MARLLELHRFKSNPWHRSKASSLILTAADVASSSSEEGDGNRLKSNGVLPILVAARPNKHKNEYSRTHHLQQVLMNTEQRSGSNRILVNHMIEQAPTRYLPVPTFLERRGLVYPHLYSRDFVEDYAQPRRDHHLPRHAEKLVNRFIHSLEDAHRDSVSSSVLFFLSVICQPDV